MENERYVRDASGKLVTVAPQDSVSVMSIFWPEPERSKP